MNGQKQILKTSIQSIPQQLLLQKLLLVPATRLEDVIQEELMKNPLLEEVPASYADSPDSADGCLGGEADDSVRDQEEDPLDFRNQKESDFSSSGSDDDVFEGLGARVNRDEGNFDPTSIIASEDSGWDLLYEQLRMKNLPEKIRKICESLLGNMDSSGYIDVEPAFLVNEFSYKEDMDVTIEEVEEAIREIQTLEPAGIGARNEQECLLLQLKQLPESMVQECAIEVISDHFEEFLNQRNEQLRQQLGKEKEEFDKVLKLIKSLNPKPGNLGSLQSGEEERISPDFTVFQEEGKLVLTVNDYHQTQLQLSQYYIDMLEEYSRNIHKSKKDKEATSFLQSNKNSAELFINAISLRRTVLWKTMSYILKVQEAYFMSGDDSDLKPLLLKDIAEATGADISTISRIVSQRYVETEFGVIRMNKLLMKSHINEKGEVFTANNILDRLQYWVDSEDKASPYSDNELAEKLSSEGIKISRRTVAKYRLKLEIPSCSQRKELQNE